MLVAPQPSLLLIVTQLGGRGACRAVLDLQEELREWGGPDFLLKADLFDEEEVAEQVRVTAAVATLLRSTCNTNLRNKIRLGFLITAARSALYRLS